MLPTDTPIANFDTSRFHGELLAEIHETTDFVAAQGFEPDTRSRRLPGVGDDAWMDLI